MLPQKQTSGIRHYLERELEEQVQSGTEIWEFLRTASLDGVWYWDLENPEQEWMSPEFWRLFGIDPATRSHCPDEWQDLIHPDDLATALDNFNKHSADPNHPYDQIVRYKHADGSTVWVRCRGMAIRDEAGKPIRMLGAHNDMTPMKMAEEAAVRERHLAAQAIADKAFAYSLSHEMKSPTNSIRLLLAEMRRSLAEGDLDDAESLLGMAEKMSDSMLALAESLLEYTRAVGAKTEMADVDLDEIIQDLKKTMAADLAASEATVTVDNLGWVHGCAWQLRQYLHNMVSNAIKYHRDGVPPVVEISSRPMSDGRVMIETSDNGIGLREEDRERAFELFRRVHKPGSYSGTGLGLALCAQIATNHDTDITVNSVLDQGTVFGIALAARKGSE